MNRTGRPPQLMDRPPSMTPGPRSGSIMEAMAHTGPPHPERSMAADRKCRRERRARGETLRGTGPPG